MQIAQNIIEAFGSLGQKLAINQSDIARQVAQNGLETLVKDKDKAFSAAAKSYENSDISDELMKSFRGQYREAISTLNDIRKTSGELSSKQIADAYGNRGHIGKAMAGTKAYFTEDGKKAARIGTAAAGTAGLMVGGRLLSGGSLTHNNTGERDIVGIPFV